MSSDVENSEKTINEEAVKKENKPPTSKRNKIILAVVIILCVVGFYGYIKYGEYYPATDDAYVNANVVHVAAQVSGKVDQVLVENNQYVKKGELLFTIDPKQYEYNLAKSKADYALYQQKAISSQDAIASAKAQLKEVEAKQFVATQKEKRYAALVKQGMASKQEGDEIKGSYEVANDEVKTAELTIHQQEAAYKVDQAQVASAKSEVDLAKLNLSYTKIYAATNGYIGKFSTRPGSMINVGDNLFVLIGDDSWWVDANYKETNMSRLKVGQSVSIQLSMYPDKELKGKVQSVSRGSGSVFSLLPPENATGNWVKVTQRFPVKITLTNYKGSFPLRVGASATVEVDTLK